MRVGVGVGVGGNVQLPVKVIDPSEYVCVVDPLGVIVSITILKMFSNAENSVKYPPP